MHEHRHTRMYSLKPEFSGVEYPSVSTAYARILNTRKQTRRLETIGEKFFSCLNCSVIQMYITIVGWGNCKKYAKKERQGEAINKMRKRQKMLSFADLAG